MRTKEYTDNLLFARARNQAKRECIKEGKLFERMETKEVKINPKYFWKYFNSKLKV